MNLTFSNTENHANFQIYRVNVFLLFFFILYLKTIRLVKREVLNSVK